MKRGDLIRHLRTHGCEFMREGRRHSIWVNPATGDIEEVPRHTEIKNYVARKICRHLSIPIIGRENRQ